MNKSIALVVYPNFSMQEITCLSGLFRWYYDSETVVFASSLEPVKAEEGFLIQPHKTFDEFHIEDYDCLILSGCSDFRESIRDQKLIAFLQQFQQHSDYVIGAICAGPMYLALAGLLKGKHYTNSLYMEANEMLSFIEEDHYVVQPVVIDGNIVTAMGLAYREFAVAVARKLGYECPDQIYSGVPNPWIEEEHQHHFSSEDMEEFKRDFQDFMR